jgi:hypothetical protein
VGNAIKFTAAGDVRLEVSIVSSDGGAVRLRFDVLDSGAGIRSDQLGLIFQPFQQVGNAIERSGGTGLGLSITREIVNVMEGVIEVVSTVGEGSRFRVEASFPRAAVELPAPGPAPEAPTAGAEEGGVEEGRNGGPQAMAIPPVEHMARLLTLARAGNMRAVRAEASAIRSLDQRCGPFADRLEALAAAYQSPEVLRFVEQQMQCEAPNEMPCLAQASSHPRPRGRQRSCVTSPT